MARRSDPARICAARREATIRRLEGAGMLRQEAEAAVTAWEVRTAQDGVVIAADAWDAAYRKLSLSASDIRRIP
jgi:hypothetical protein